jgi:hypothetical protein
VRRGAKAPGRGAGDRYAVHRDQGSARGVDRLAEIVALERAAQQALALALERLAGSG